MLKGEYYAREDETFWQLGERCHRKIRGRVAGDPPAFSGPLAADALFKILAFLPALG